MIRLRRDAYGEWWAYFDAKYTESCPLECFRTPADLEVVRCWVGFSLVDAIQVVQDMITAYNREPK